MTIDEAIKHCEDVVVKNIKKTNDRNADDPEARDCFECAYEHQQLAEWLKELKRYRKIKELCQNEIAYINNHWLDFRSPSEAKSGYEFVLDKIKEVQHE